jgi:hypothetical protein
MPAITRGNKRGRSPHADSSSDTDDAPIVLAFEDVVLAPLRQGPGLAGTHVARHSAKRLRVAPDHHGNPEDATALWSVLPRASAEPIQEALVLPAVHNVDDGASGAPPLLQHAPQQGGMSLLAPSAAPAPPQGTCVDMVEGVPVRVEARGTEGTLGYYRRLCVTCPLHSLPGAPPCRVRRNTGTRQTARLGVCEPVAYLGAWLAAAGACATCDEHMLFRPSDADTRAYVVEHRLL